VGRGNKSHRIYSLVEDIGYSPEYFFGRHPGTICIVLADLNVLTIDALKIAVGKKYVTDSLIAGNDRLFAFMDANGCYIEAIGAVTVTIVTAFPGRSAKPGAVYAKFAMADFGFYRINITKLSFNFESR
jgi:hypothetical protein